MVTNYSVPRLTSQTPSATCDKLTSALKGVKGVQSVSLNQGKHQFEITGNDKGGPKFAEIAAASKKAGFEVEMPEKKKS